MGRFGVPSALAIGSIAPDFWYFVPFVARHESHSLAGLAWFCMPAGLLMYLFFHLLLKQPLIALVSPRLGCYTPARLPAVPWYAVIVSLLVGALTHLGWDALTHAHDDAWRHNWLQHASTVLGALIVAAWSWRKLQRAPAAPSALSLRARIFTILALLGAAALAAVWSADLPSLDPMALRQFLRTAGLSALHVFGAAVVVYCVLFQRKMARRAA
jgi:hypothetical protein